MGTGFQVHDSRSAKIHPNSEDYWYYDEYSYQDTNPPDQSSYYADMPNYQGCYFSKSPETNFEEEQYYSDFYKSQYYENAQYFDHMNADPQFVYHDDSYMFEGRSPDQYYYGNFYDGQHPSQNYENFDCEYYSSDAVSSVPRNCYPFHRVSAKPGFWNRGVTTQSPDELIYYPVTGYNEKLPRFNAGPSVKSDCDYNPKRM